VSYSPAVRSVSLLLVLLVTGCDASQPGALVVQVRSDLVPGRELGAVRVTLARGDGESVAEQTRDAVDGDAWAEGIRVAEIPGLAAGDYQADVVALDPDGAVVVRRPVRASIDGGTTVVTVLLTRDCLGVECPADAGNPEAVACLAGRCVPADCVEEDPASCGTPDCTADGDCDPSFECASARCTESGACLSVPDDAMCAGDALCLPDLGGCATPGGIVWVDDDAAPGGDGSRDAPLRTIDEALAEVTPERTTISILPGTYDAPSAPLMQDGLSLSGAGVDAVTISGSDRDAGLELAASAVTVRGLTVDGFATGIDASGDGAVLEDVRVRNAVRGLSDRAPAIGVLATGDELTLRRVEVTGVRGASDGAIGVDVSGVNGCTLEQVRVEDVEVEGTSDFTQAMARGVWLNQVTDCTVRDLWIESVRSTGAFGGVDGLFLGDSDAIDLRHVAIVGVEVERSDDDGRGVLFIGRTSGSGEPVTLRNVTVADVRAATGEVSGIFAGSSEPFAVRDFLVVDAGACVTHALAPTRSVDAEHGQVFGCVDSQPGIAESDPRLVDVAGRDLHLAPDSPAIDAGDPAASYGAEPDPNGCRVNLGYYGGTAEATSAAGAMHCP